MLKVRRETDFVIYKVKKGGPIINKCERREGSSGHFITDVMFGLKGHKRKWEQLVTWHSSNLKCT